MPYGREILLRNVKYALRRVDLFHFTESVSFLFHNPPGLFHIEHREIFHINYKLVSYSFVSHYALHADYSSE